MIAEIYFEEILSVSINIANLLSSIINTPPFCLHCLSSLPSFNYVYYSNPNLIQYIYAVIYLYANLPPRCPSHGLPASPQTVRRKPNNPLKFGISRDYIIILPIKHHSIFGFYSCTCSFLCRHSLISCTQSSQPTLELLIIKS